MDILGIIKDRRSIRKYKDKIPGDSQIGRILDAARWAPSGLNNQPWKFLVIKDKKVKGEVAGLTKYSDIIKNAPVIICVFLDIGRAYNREKDVMAIGACIQNILLAAKAMGLGTCWLGEILNKKEEVSMLLNIGSEYELMAVIALGFPDEQKLKGSRRPLEDLAVKLKGD